MADKYSTHIVDLGPENLLSKEIKLKNQNINEIIITTIFRGCWLIKKSKLLGAAINSLTMQLIDFSDFENMQKVPKYEISNFFSLPNWNFNTLRVSKKKTLSFYLSKTLALYRTSNKRIKFSNILIANTSHPYSGFGYRFHEYLKRTGHILVIFDNGVISRINYNSMKIMKPLTLNIYISVRPPPVISKCEKYLIVSDQNTSIQIYSLMDNCKTSITIQFDFDFKYMVLGKKKLYILESNWEVITIINIIDFLENKNKKKQSKKKRTKCIRQNKR